MYVFVCGSFLATCLLRHPSNLDPAPDGSRSKHCLIRLTDRNAREVVQTIATCPTFDRQRRLKSLIRFARFTFSSVL